MEMDWINQIVQIAFLQRAVKLLKLAHLICLYNLDHVATKRCKHRLVFADNYNGFMKIFTSHAPSHPNILNVREEPIRRSTK